MFSDDGFRRAWLAELGAASDGVSYSATAEATLNALADHLETHLDVSAILACAR